MIPLGVLASSRVAPSGLVVLSDTFARADGPLRGTVADTGQLWVGADNKIVILSGAARASSSGDNFAVADAGVANCVITATLNLSGSASLVFRAGTTGAIAHFWTLDITNSVMAVLRKSTGPLLQQGSVSRTIPNGPHDVQLTLSGTTITAAVAGETLTITDATYSSQTGVGFYSWGNSASTWDDLEVTAP